MQAIPSYGVYSNPYSSTVSGSAGTANPAATGVRTAAGATGAYRPPASLVSLDQSAGMMPMVMQLLQMFLSLVQNFMGGGSSSFAGNPAIQPRPQPLPQPVPQPLPQAVPGQPPVPTPVPVQQPPVQQPPAGRRNDPNRITVYQIDVFRPDNTGFNHGNAIADTLRGGGQTPGLANQVTLKQIDVSGSNSPEQFTRRVSSALQTVLAQAQSGQDVDAVNLSLQDFQATASIPEVRNLIGQLSAMGIPVVVSAGNGGPNQVNQLVGPGAFIVESMTNGMVNGNSGRGNIRANGRTTSFAAANLTPQIAQMINAGMTLQQVQQALGIR